MTSYNRFVHVAVVRLFIYMYLLYISALYVTALCERVHYALRVPTFLATILATAANGGEIRKRDDIKRNIAKTIINAL